MSKKAIFPEYDESSSTVVTPEVLPPQMYRSGLKVTYAGMVVNLLLMIIKFIAGVVANSSAMIADSFHSLTDMVTDFGAILGLKYLTKPADEEHKYGHGRVETVISMLMGLGITVTGLILFVGGTRRIFLFITAGEIPVMPGILALFAGIFSIFSKEILFRYTVNVGKRIGSTSIMANAWHHRSDALSSIGTVAGIGGAILLGSSWTVLDPAAAVFVSILIVNAGFRIGWKSVRELVDESLSYQSETAVQQALMGVEGVKQFHNLRTRSLGRYVSVDVHILVDPGLSVKEGHEISTAAEKAIRHALGNVAYINIHIEPEEH